MPRTESINPRSIQRVHWAAIAAMLVAAIVYLAMRNRIWWCECGQWNPISLVVHSRHNSQHPFDAYSLSHLLHGILFYGAFAWLTPRWSLGWKLVGASAIEILWEVVENSPVIINRYRAATISLGYEGDSILNSIADVASFIIGFHIARRIGPWWSIAVFLAVELALLWWIRDNLMLNILMLLWPIDAIRSWQSGG